MNDSMPSKRRLITVAVISVTILVAVVLLTGNQTLSSPSGAAIITSLPATSGASVPTAPPPSSAVTGSVSLSATHLSGHTWRFLYTIRATGKVPIAGFQLTGPTAHLFRVIGPGWNYYGNGVCGTTGPPGVLIYWSTNQASPDLIQPGKSTTFGFDVNTSGTAPLSYSLSYGASTPYFGQTKGPASSTLAISGPCK